jgi:hypothetical protein
MNTAQQIIQYQSWTYPSFERKEKKAKEYMVCFLVGREAPDKRMYRFEDDSCLEFNIKTLTIKEVTLSQFLGTGKMKPETKKQLAAYTTRLQQKAIDTHNCSLELQTRANHLDDCLNRWNETLQLEHLGDEIMLQQLEVYQKMTGVK